jgi:hypothetical protein
MIAGFFSVFVAAAILAVVIACGIALLPALVVLGVIGLAVWLIVGTLGIVFRLIGWVLLVVLAAPLLIAGFAVAFALGIAVLHLALPVLLVIGVIWLIARHHRPLAPTLPSAS